MRSLVLHGENVNEQYATQVAQQVSGTLNERDSFFTISRASSLAATDISTLRDQYEFDINPLPDDFNAAQIKLLITDMDSTLINIECIDEIGDFMGIKPQIAEITEAAMRGELDFAGSLTKRMNLLKGLDVDALNHVYNERLQLNQGAEHLVAGLKSRGIKVALVSGGFTYFTSRLQQRLQLDYTLANVLDIHDGKLTGNVVGNIVGAEAKANFLLKLCQELTIEPSQAIAVGDGANDLKMMSLAGLSVAYHAKPKVQAQATTALNHCGLNAILDFLHV